MKGKLKENLTDKDKDKALESLRLLANGIPIMEEDSNEIIGWIERPNMEAIKFILNNDLDGKNKINYSPY